MRQPGLTAWQRCLIAFGIVVALVGLAIWGLAIYPRHRHYEWYRGVEDRIVRLADKRPEGMTPGQWAYCLHWTWNLHTNCGGYEDWRNSGDRASFSAEFDRRLQAAVDLSTIDWIWDQYASRATGGRDYASLYRPTDPGNIRKWYEEEKESYDLEPWLDRLSRLPRRRE